MKNLTLLCSLVTFLWTTHLSAQSEANTDLTLDEIAIQMAIDYDKAMSPYFKDMDADVVKHFLERSALHTFKEKYALDETLNADLRKRFEAEYERLDSDEVYDATDVIYSDYSERLYQLKRERAADDDYFFLVFGSKVITQLIELEATMSIVHFNEIIEILEVGRKMEKMAQEKEATEE